MRAREALVATTLAVAATTSGCTAESGTFSIVTNRADCSGFIERPIAPEQVIHDLAATIFRCYETAPEHDRRAGESNSLDVRVRPKRGGEVLLGALSDSRFNDGVDAYAKEAQVVSIRTSSIQSTGPINPANYDGALIDLQINRTVNEPNFWRLTQHNLPDRPTTKATNREGPEVYVEYPYGVTPHSGSTRVEGGPTSPQLLKCVTGQIERYAIDAVSVSVDDGTVPALGPLVLSPDCDVT